MKRKSISIYFFIAIFLLLFVQKAIHDRQDFIEIGHFFSAPALECTLPEDLTVVNRDDLKIFFIADASACLILQTEDLFIQLPHPFFSTIPPDQQPLVLRC
jgi:hypothetical protein